jgi:DNA mismatch repair protein MutS2
MDMLRRAGEDVNVDTPRAAGSKTGMIANDKALHDLEWSRLLDHLAARCASEDAAARCRALPFLDDDEAWERLASISELVSCFREDDRPPRLAARPVAEALAHVRGAGAVPADALRAIAMNLELYAALARYLDNRRDRCPRNAAAHIPQGSERWALSLSRLAAEIGSSFEPDGAVADTASPALGALRRRAVSLRQGLLARLDEIATRDADLLQERTVTIRNDRYVLPVRTDAHRRIRGIVHGTSSTGATVFVEPEEVVGLANDLTLAREDVSREEARILGALSVAVRDQIGEVTFACAAIVEAEVRIAAARLALDLDAAAPQRADPGEAEIVRARHPLLALDGVAVVPATVSLRRGTCLLVSGPNAGGKTVLLKTVGLFGLMLAAGLPVPLDPRSRMGIPRAVLTDIGDDQSLENNLSTFSAHMKNIAAILAAARAGGVALLDELCGGTDPLEGAALAEATLDALVAGGATALATTHFDTLKSRAQNKPGYVNAAMGFDGGGGGPTFELRLGLPGSSSAFAVASRFGIPDGVLESARRFLPEGARELAAAVEALERAKHAAEIERMALAEQRGALATEARRHAEEVARLRDRDEKFVDKEREALWQEIRRARERVRDAETALKRRRVDPAATKTARDAVNAVAERLTPGGSLDPGRPDEMPGAPARPEDIREGARVHVVSLGKEAIVAAPLRGNTVFVTIGTARLRVPFEDLRFLGEARPRGGSARRPAVPARATAPDRTEAVPGCPVRTADNAVDLRGATADEAIDRVDAFLDAMLRDGAEAAFVIHGFGTGSLRDAVRSYLDGSRYVARWRPGDREEGGDGVTVAWLR